MNAIFRAAKVSVGAVVLGSALSANATSLTLDTTYLQANAVFSMSDLAGKALAVTSSTVSALGNATDQGGLSFNLPVTKVNLSLGIPLLLPLVTPNWGNATGSALEISREGNSIYLANFAIDYSTDQVLADITVNGTTSKSASLYTFDAGKLSIGLSGLSLTMHQELSNLRLSSTAAESFTDGLDLPSFLVGTLTAIDFGTITIDVKTSLRTGINASAFTVSVPEAPPFMMMGLGLVGIAVVSRRRLQARR
jgi:hypothetical protein